MALRIVFAGTAEFAVTTLKALFETNHELVAVYTQPDRPSGRGQKLCGSLVKQFALEHNLPLYQPETLKDIEAQQQLKSLNADIMVDVAYGLLLPEQVLQMFRFGCINIHPSLLPRWRGAAPIQHSLLAGDTETGVTIMQVDMGWDTGDILCQKKIAINSDDNATTLSEKLSKLGTELLLKTLADIEQNKITPIKQGEKQSCYAPKITKQDAKLDWNLSAIELARQVQAYNPWPVSYAELDGKIIRIWKAVPIEEKTNLPAGTVSHADKNGIDIATGDGILRVLELQLPGGKILPVVAILNSKRDLFMSGKQFNA